MSTISEVRPVREIRLWAKGNLAFNRLILLKSTHKRSNAGSNSNVTAYAMTCRYMLLSQGNHPQLSTNTQRQVLVVFVKPTVLRETQQTEADKSRQWNKTISCYLWPVRLRLCSLMLFQDKSWRWPKTRKN